MNQKLADRINQIIQEQKITKREFARRIGVGETYVYVITGGGRKNRLNQNISPALARVIGTEFGYETNWILTGEGRKSKLEGLRQEALSEIESLSKDELLKLKIFLDTL